MGNSCSRQFSQRMVRPSTPAAPDPIEQSDTDADSFQSATMTPRPLVKEKADSDNRKPEPQSPQTTAGTESASVEQSDEHEKLIIIRPTPISEQRGDHSISEQRDNSIVEQCDHSILEQHDHAILDSGSRTSTTARSDDEAKETAATLENGVVINSPIDRECFDEAKQQKLGPVARGRKRRRPSEDGGKSTTKKRKPTRTALFPSVLKSSMATAFLSQQDSANENTNTSENDGSRCSPPFRSHRNSRMVVQKTFNTGDTRQHQHNKCRTFHNYYNHRSFSSRPWHQRFVAYPSGGLIEMKNKNSIRSSSRENRNDNHEVAVVTAYASKDEPHKREQITVNHTVIHSLFLDEATKHTQKIGFNPLLFELPTSIDEDVSSLSSTYNTPIQLHSSHSSCDGNDPSLSVGEHHVASSIPQAMTTPTTGFGIDLSQLAAVSPSPHHAVSDCSTASRDDEVFRLPPATERRFHYGLSAESFESYNHDTYEARPATARPTLRRTESCSNEEQSSCHGESQKLKKHNLHYSSPLVVSSSTLMSRVALKLNKNNNSDESRYNNSRNG